MSFISQEALQAVKIRQEQSAGTIAYMSYTNTSKQKRKSFIDINKEVNCCYIIIYYYIIIIIIIIIMNYYYYICYLNHNVYLYVYIMQYVNIYKSARPRLNCEFVLKSMFPLIWFLPPLQSPSACLLLLPPSRCTFLHFIMIYTMIIIIYYIVFF